MWGASPDKPRFRMLPAVSRELQMGVAMEASSSSHFLAEFISQFPVPLPVPAVNTDLMGSLLPAGSPLSSVES